MMPLLLSVMRLLRWRLRPLSVWSERKQRCRQSHKL